MEFKKSDILKWTKALRSGKYKQGKRQLQSENGFCCLGVACDIFIKEKVKIKDADGLLSGTYPVNQRAPKWLKAINSDFENKQFKAAPLETAAYSLSSLNDGFGHNQLTFDEIADCLEAVYIHKVLD